jgi:hypothetical protein
MELDLRTEAQYLYLYFLEYRYQHNLYEVSAGTIVYRIFLHLDASLVIVERRRYCFLGPKSEMALSR